LVRTRQLELEAAQRRRTLGAATEYEVIAVYQRFLIDNDQLAIAGGELAKAWIRLQQSTGGQALAVSDTDD